MLALGHLTTDLYSSTVATMQPVLGEVYGLSLAQAGLLGGVFMFASSVLQLPFGILSDRHSSRLFSVFGPLIAAIFLSSLAWAGGFPGLLVLAFLGGMGVAAFHPQSTKDATHLSGARKGIGVALFITAGTFGLACGPPYFSFIIERFGFPSFGLAMIPAFVVCGFLLWRLPAPHVEPGSAGKRVDWQALRAQWRPLGLHYSLVFIRSIVQLGVGQFLTLYLVRERGMEVAQASLILALFFLAAATGSLLGGNLADRAGGKRVIGLSMASSAPLFAGFLVTTGWVSILLLFFGGVFLLLTIPVNVVMAQELAPTQRGIVSSLMMGFAWGVAGITVVPLIGLAADHFGLQTVLWAVVLAPLAGLPLALRLPEA
ncbi:MAG: MFS transporter [Bryobacterales bacterium]|nr:MFS transporter [Acidobacteriota bacterium]MCB9384310.1 MFS transporter [Bryobacterales bacterium]